MDASKSEHNTEAQAAQGEWENAKVQFVDPANAITGGSQGEGTGERY
jgi:hypothetical protein